jgi:hypothetical protein
MAITHSTTIRNGLCNYTVDALDQGSGAGKLKIYSDTGLTNLLATFTLADPAFGAASSGQATAAAITPITASASGTALAFSATDSDNVVIFQGNVGVAGSGASCILNTTTLVSGGSLSVNTFTYAAPV